MGQAKSLIPPAKLVFGLLVASESLRRQCLEQITTEFGPIDHQSRLEPFTFTDYYNDEMGETIYRLYLSAERLIQIATLPQIKHLTNRLEAQMAHTDAQGRRRRQVNIDPGYLTESKLVLATRKDYSHRIYLADSIFAEVTLHYRRPDGFRPFPWTYPDYARPEACEFFNKVRDTYRRQLRESAHDITPDASDRTPAKE